MSVDPWVAEDGPDLRPVVLAGAVGSVAAFWLAPSAGLPAPTIALVATSAVAVLAAVLLRELGGRRRRAAEARRALQALRLDEARFKLLADHAADMIVESDRDFVRRFVSPSSMALLGYAPEELLGTEVRALVHPDDWPAYERALRGLLDGDRERAVTTQRYRRKDGSYIWTEGSVMVTRDAMTGEPNGYVGGLRDVTERHLAEAALRDSEAFLRGVIDSSPDCIKVLDLDGQVAFMSRNGLCLLEFECATDPIGLDFAGLWPSAVQPEVRSAIAAARSGAVSRFAASCLSAKARPLTLGVVVTPIADASGRPERLLAVSRDITASAKAETALQRSEERYRLLAENSSDVVMMMHPGPDGPMLYVSPSCRRVLGHEPDAIMAMPRSSLIHPDDRVEIRQLLSRLTEADGVALRTMRVRRKDGVYISGEIAFQLAERFGEPIVVAALRDVTERQQRADDLAAARRSAEAALKAAERASEAKSDFLAAMSHEIRTPLNSIIGFTDLMLDAGDLPERAQGHAELIRASGAALLTVVNDILDFSKIEAGAVEVEAIPFDPQALARHCAAIVRGYAGTKALDIDVELGDGLPSCLVGDEARLRQVLLNLLNNAVKFTARGRVTLRVRHLAGTEGGDTIGFEVADTGIGIARAQQSRLFERFSQVDSSVARRFGGSGLGLAICKRLVGLMGGEIGVSSQEGAGSLFWFSVTLRRGAAAVPKLASPAALGPRRAGRILVVEDIDINQRLAVALLDGAGHRVDVVGDGAVAVSTVAGTAYDLVLMDVQMPGMDGVTATRLIRASDGPHSDVPIIAMTANVFPEQIRAFRDAGMDDHVGKPLDRALLHAAVDRWMAPARPEGVPLARDARPSEPAMAFDGAIYEQLLAYLGVARLDDVLARFAASLRLRFAAGDLTPENQRRWEADAHVVVSVAGMTGFAELSRLCRAFEVAVLGSPAHAAALAAVRAARDAAEPRLAELRRGLTTPALHESVAWSPPGDRGESSLGRESGSGFIESRSERVRRKRKRSGAIHPAPDVSGP